jgi:hypothetical protein
MARPTFPLFSMPRITIWFNARFNATVLVSFIAYFPSPQHNFIIFYISLHLKLLDFQGQLSIELDTTCLLFRYSHSPLWFAVLGLLLELVRLDEKLLQLPAPMIFASNTFRRIKKLELNNAAFTETPSVR